MLEQATEQTLIVCKRKASLFHLLRDPVGFFRGLSRHEAAATHISLGGRNFFVLSDPSLIRDILTTRGSSFEKFPQGNPKQKLFGDGLLTSEGSAQKRQRRMLLPAFHRDRLQTYVQEMVTCVEGLTAAWQSGTEVDVLSQMSDVTLEIIGRTLLGVNNRPLMHEIGTHLHTILNLVNRFVLPWGDLMMKLPLPSTIRYRRAVKRLDEIIYQLIQQERAGSSSENLIGILIETGSTDAEIRDEIVTMIVAGHETVAVGLTWCLFLLATHPELQADLGSRVADTLGGRIPDIDDYQQLEFLQHAFAESLRLHPPIWILGRRNFETYTFRGFVAPKSSIFLVCMADLHRRPEFFTDPNTFAPARWKAPSWPAYAYIPFGGGDRRCIGERFAWMEAVFTLACLLRRWRFSVNDPTSPPADAKLTLHPRGPLNVRITAA